MEPRKAHYMSITHRKEAHTFTLSLSWPLF